MCSHYDESGFDGPVIRSAPELEDHMAGVRQLSARVQRMVSGGLSLNQKESRPAHPIECEGARLSAANLSPDGKFFIIIRPIALPKADMNRKKSLFDGLPGGENNPHYQKELAALEVEIGDLKQLGTFQELQDRSILNGLGPDLEMDIRDAKDVEALLNDIYANTFCNHADNVALITAYFAKHSDRPVDDALREALAAWEKIMEATPVGHEDLQKGAATYNWLHHAYLFFLKYLPDDSRPAPAPVAASGVPARQRYHEWVDVLNESADLQLTGYGKETIVSAIEKFAAQAVAEATAPDLLRKGAELSSTYKSK